ncbi:MAG TPA: 6-pyruvoyl-tetrahydropterin synthase-related protein [Rhizomicrobium sp.]|nr:6-pyruvoyl-tetrahydropterin synthase-related protein [Rhizomicrobium sp.]
MSARISAFLWAAATLLAAALLARNILAIPVLAPLDPNEGWNAAHALSLLANGHLYPPPGSLMVNNYPPLSFYLVAALAGLTGDAVVAGRILSLLSFLSVGAGIALVCRMMGCGARACLCATLFFAVLLLAGSDYVAMADPQLLGHAVQLAGLLLLLRGHILPAAAVFALSLFVKHNLLALPLTATAWLWWRDRRSALHFVLSGGAAAGLGLVLFYQAYGTSLLAALSSPRLVSWANVRLAISHLWWAGLPSIALIMVLAMARGAWKRFCLIYAASALAIGLIFSAGDGVDTNAFFDFAIACSLTLGLSVGRKPLLGALCVLPPLAFLSLNFQDNNFFFTRGFAAQSARDIAFLKSRPGPALCDQLSLCLWAGKGAAVDVFNIGEQIKTGARSPSALTSMIAGRRFAVLQLQNLNALGPAVRSAIAQNYRLHHSDDNGSFLIPKSLALSPHLDRTVPFQLAPTDKRPAQRRP